MATMTYTDGVYLYRGTSDERHAAKAAGFRWDPTEKRWWTKCADKAAELAAFADEATRARLQGVVEAQNEALQASRATDATVDVPAPEGLAYLPYQRAGIAYAMAREGVLIGDEMGLGKTIQALGIINADPSVFATLVICPASLRLNWARESAKWLVRPIKISVITGGKPTDVQVTHDPANPAGELVVCNYDVLGKHADLRERAWDLLIVDEAHYLKNGKAQRTQAVLGKWDRDPAKRKPAIQARRRVFLTGTPILNRPVELHSIAKALDPQEFGNWQRFVTRYCDGHRTRFGWDVSGASNLEELQDKLRRSCMVRRLKADVLTELPPKQRQVVVLPANGLTGMVKAESAALQSLDARLETLRAEAELAKAGEDEGAYEAAVSALRDASSAAFTEISALRHELAVAKIPYVADFVIEAAGEHPVVVMAHHHDVVDGLKAALTDVGLSVVTVTGRDAMEARQAAVDAFQGGKADVFIGNMKAAGVGLTLTRSSHVVFAELDWTPGNLSQAEDRCHRIGQTDSVLVHHLVLDGSLDARMAQIVVEKQNVIDAAMDRELPEHTLAAKAPVLPPSGAASSDTSRDKLREAGEKLSDEQIALVHQALRCLAQVCDGAAARDNHGFNGVDTRIGKALAMAPRLTVRQAGLGWKVVRKYRRQLEGYGLDYTALYGTKA